MRVAMSGPAPIPSRCSSEAGVVMLFHSPMSRMNRTLPEAVDGESEPKTASWRAHHGAIDEGEDGDAPDRGRERDRRRPRLAGPSGPPGPPAIPGEDETERQQDEQAVVAGQRGQPGEQAGEHERTARVRAAAERRERPSRATR